MQRILSGCVLLFCLGGCGTPSGVLELVDVARSGLAQAKVQENQLHESHIGHLRSRIDGLDAAFDADVKLAAAGELTDIQGRPVGLNPDWVLSARKGYVAARDILQEQISDARTAHVQRQDNLEAAEDALRLAMELILQRQNFSLGVRRYLRNYFEEPNND